MSKYTDIAVLRDGTTAAFLWHVACNTSGADNHLSVKERGNGH